MMQWVTRRDPTMAPADAERRTLEFMATMPAWRDHPDLRRRLGRD